MESETEPRNSERLTDRVQLGVVSFGFGEDRVNVGERGARKLELSARLERDRCVVALQRDEGPAFGLADGLVAEATLERGEHADHALLALVRHRGVGSFVDAELFGFSPDAPLTAGLHGLLERSEEVVVPKRPLTRAFYDAKRLAASESLSNSGFGQEVA